MFHTYVLRHGGKPVDFDRASYLMDKELLQQAIDAMRDERENSPHPDAICGVQWVWDYYCQRHAEKFGEPFRPHVDPDWDT